MKSLVWILVPFAAYVGLVALLGDWIIDDAGISFAYARNLAEGHGLVSQPGRVPVEGFSNFLWVLACVPFLWIGAFDPIWLPKILGALLVLGSLALVQPTLARTTGKRWLGLAAAGFIATAPPIVIWSASGLENALLLALVVGMWSVSTLRTERWELWGGALAGLAAMTRPDGLVYLLAMPLVSLGELVGKRTTPRRALLDALRALAAFAAVWLPFFAFRLHRFGLPLPHTYYAKLEYMTQGERLKALVADWARSLREKVWALGEGIAGPIGPWLIAACLIAAVVLARKQRLDRPVAMGLTLFALSAGAFVWLSDDWMGEFRFATPAVGMGWIVMASLVPGLLEGAPVVAKKRGVLVALGLALVVAVVPANVSRLVRFAENPPTPYRHVERQFARRFTAFAGALGVEKGSILIADVGAMFFESRLTAYDIAGLTEPDIVRTLRKGSPIWHYDHPEFYRWVFEEVRPTFVVTHNFWTNVTALEYDPRFARDYVAIDSFADEYVKTVYKRNLHSGEFVRRDALKTPDALETMRKSYVFPPRAEPVAFRIGDRLRAFRSGEPGAEDLRREAIHALSWGNRNPNRAAALSRRLLLRAPNDLDARERLAVALDQGGRSGEAHGEWLRAAHWAAKSGDLALLERARRRLGDPSLPVPERDDEVGQVEYARRLTAAGKREYARRAIERTLALNPRNAVAYFLVGVNAGAEQRFEEALAAYRRSVELDPRSADTQNNLGFTLGALGRFGEAVPSLEEALRLRPDFALARANLAWVKSELARGETAVARAKNSGRPIE